MGYAYGFFYSTVHGVYSPRNRKGFVVSNALSPVDISYFTLDASGVVAETGESPYHGDYPMSGPLFLSGSEDLVFTGQGTYFRTDTLTYVGKLGMNGAVGSLSYSATADEAIVTGYSYQASYHRFNGPLLLTSTDVALPVIDGAQSYGIAVFHSANDNHVALVQTGSASTGVTGLRYYVVLR